MSILDTTLLFLLLYIASNTNHFTTAIITLQHLFVFSVYRYDQIVDFVMMDLVHRMIMFGTKDDVNLAGLIGGYDGNLGIV